MAGLLDSMSVIYGSPPYGWNTPQRLQEITNLLEAMPRIHGNVIPLTTFLIFARSVLRFELITQFTAVFSEKIKNSFVERLPTLEEQSRVQVALDDGNFKAEVAAFGNIDEAIKEPHLDVSPLYRYMAAIQQGMLGCVDDKLISDAVVLLRKNPYLFFAYGDNYQALMPITWGNL